MFVNINDIIVKNRFRKDYGDIDSLSKSIKDIGLLHPPVINEDNILIAGERRLKALKQLGYTEIPVNKINLKEVIRGEYDENAVRKNFSMQENVAIWEAMESYKNQYDKSALSDSDSAGFRRDRASKFLGVSTDTLSKAKQIISSNDQQLLEVMENKNVNTAYKMLKKKEKLEEIKQNVKEDTKVKGIYEVDALLFLKGVENESFDLCITDPPYNIGFKSVRGGGTNDFNDNIDYNHLGLIFTEIYRVLKKDSHFYCFIGYQNYPDYVQMIQNAGFKIQNCLIWVKNNHTPTNYDYSYAHTYEMIIFATKGNRPLKEFGRDVLNFDNVMGKEHNSQKPSDLIKYLIKQSSNEGETVLDCFAGSGVTLLSAKELKRNYVGCEINKEYYEMIVNKLVKDENKKTTKSDTA